MSPKSPTQSRTTLAQIMGPQESNNHGNVHGGILMKLCDEAGALAAMKHARQPCVTVAVDRMTFNAPVRLGELVTFEAQVTWVGRTSIEVEIVVCAERVLTGEVTHTNTAHFLYVALDSVNGRPVEVPDLLLETEEEIQRNQDAQHRQGIRLNLRRTQRRQTNEAQ